MKKAVNYLSNKELLSEIHKSKNSFSYYVSDEYSHYDCIVPDSKKITKTLIAKIKKKKAETISQEKKSELKKAGNKNPDPKEYTCKQKDIPDESIVFRVMTYEHIPDDFERKKKAKTIADTKSKVNFPPFKHYIMDGKSLKEVGRSHWAGGLQNGHFCLDQGKITDKLARMLMMLVQRYSQRGNWRSYCVDAETEALTKRGWLKYNEITTNDTILSYNRKNLTWSSIKSIYQGEYSGLMHKLTAIGIDALITPEHKLVTVNGLKKIEDVTNNDEIVLMGENAFDEEFIEYTYVNKNVPKLIDFVSINKTKVQYTGIVWCPETEYGSFVARRNGTVYLTGNTYNDEMRGHALFQLIQIALQFDESRSEVPNPFAYYTATLANSFTRILNIEKRNQIIRDDLRHIQGEKPSFTRQVEHEMEIREETNYYGNKKENDK